MHAPVRILLAGGLALLTGCHRSSTGSTGALAAVGERPRVERHLAHAEIAAGKIPLDDLLAHGELLFTASFNTLDGAGRPESTGTGAARPRRTGDQAMNRISAPEANACSGCHNLPFPGGGGDNVANVFVLAQRLPHVNFDGGAGDGFAEQHLDTVGNERNTLGMFGAGFIELLAREMTVELQRTRQATVEAARRSGRPATAALVAKGISFGLLTAKPDGSLDTSAVDGVDADLVIKPFHQKGVVVSLREFTNNAMNHHHGMQSSERFGIGIDVDRDGHADELSDGDITAASLWQAMLRPPGRVWPGTSGVEREAAERGEALFLSVGCAECHVPMLRLQDPVFTEPGPFNPPGNLGAVNTPTVAVDLTAAGSGPRLQRERDGSVLVRAYTDFKRHDMGDQLDTEKLVQAGVPTREFLTRKLWGAANEPPFMHHGRATTLDEAIRMHGGEAERSRDLYAALPAAERNAILEFLTTLQVLPEDAASIEVDGEPSGTIGEEPVIQRHLSPADVAAGGMSPEQLFTAGEHLFAANFNTLDGAGRPASTGTGAPREALAAPHNFNRISGPDANSCAGCHNLPRTGGGGDLVANVFVLAQRLPDVNFDAGVGDGFGHHHLDDVGNERNTLGMWGAGYVELLAREMTAELLLQREQARYEARSAGEAVRKPLAAKGVSFGTLTAYPDGSVDASAAEGIDADLIVKPFHQKGVVGTLREFTNNALNHHHGIQSSERFGPGVDADRDGHRDEVTAADVTALTLYQAMLAVPGRVLPADAARRAAVNSGEALFERIGCAECHRPSLPLESSLFTEPGPFHPPGNQRLVDVEQPYAVDLNQHGALPRLQARPDGVTPVPLYSDLKRHYLGPECDNEKVVQAGVATGQFLTRKLWGFASEPPLMHHGRASTITEAIEMHGGEAAPARAAWRKLAVREQAALLDFLQSLQVLPRDTPQTVVQK